MWFLKLDASWYQKEIQQILRKCGLWSSLGLNLKYSKPQYYNYKQHTNYKLCIKSIRYNSYKAPKIHIGIVKYVKSWKYDGCITHEA